VYRLHSPGDYATGRVSQQSRFVPRQRQDNFSSPELQADPDAHSGSCSMGAGVKRAGRNADFNDDVKN
jgi:hypothetical protein